MVETLLQEMSQLSSGDDQWQAKLSVVTENLEHHIKEEEEEIFPKAPPKSQNICRRPPDLLAAASLVTARAGARSTPSGLAQPLGIGRRPPVPRSQSSEHDPIAAMVRKHQTRTVGRQRLLVDHAAVLGGRAASLRHHRCPSANRLPRGEHQFRHHDRQGDRPALSSAHRDDMGGPSTDTTRPIARQQTRLRILVPARYRPSIGSGSLRRRRGLDRGWRYRRLIQSASSFPCLSHNLLDGLT